ncbi:MAG: hypothetical protein ACI4V5_02890 [Prevotella sp.]
MKRIMHFFSALALLLTIAIPSKAAITEAKGWFESVYAQWEPVEGAVDYHVYVRPVGGTFEMLDKELVRKYPTYYRADAVGLKAGTYEMRIVPVDDANNELGTKEMTTEQLTVTAHDRSGFAHVGMPNGIGAYKNDGTLKDNAKVLYVWADNAKTVTTDVITNSKGTKTTGIGLQNIIYLYQKGYDTTPLDIRIIGTIKKDDCDALSSTSEGLQIKGNSAYQEIPLTMEGIGNDAAISGFGILMRQVKDVELRNFAVILCLDDCISLDTKNSNIWIHNMDFFYGNTGGDSDQAKGDGTVDIKASSMNVTLSYCHFYDSGKSSLGGMSNEISTAYHTYHHNWFDHSDSRHPRVRVQYFHVYNNYFDGVSKYGIGMTSGGSAFVENNYFRNTKYPMLISKQGTDAEGDGTFSGEPGGIIKAYNNTIKNAKQILYYDGSQTDGKWDAVLVSSRDEAVTATCLSGGTGYNDAADEALRTQYIESKIDNPDDVPAIVKGWLGAGRMGHGDIKWTFNNSTQDENYGVISELKNTLISYKSTLVGFADGEEISNGGATATIDAGDGKGIDPEVNDAYVPTYGGTSGGGGVVTSGEYVYGSATDYFWTIADNATATQELVDGGTITIGSNASFQTTKNVAGSDGTVYSDKIGSIQLNKKDDTTGTAGGNVTFYYPDGIQSMVLYLVRTGTYNADIQTSDDGSNFTSIKTVTASKGVNECTVTPAAPVKYIRVVNNATGATHIQGFKLLKAGEGGGSTDDPIGDDRSNDATAEFAINGTEILTSGTYTMNVAFDATETEYTVTVTPADMASVKSYTGATQSGDNYIIAAPAAGETATATFTIVAENETTTKTYTISIKKGVDPSTLPETEVCYFTASTKSPSMSNVVVSGNYSNSKGSVSYNGTTYTDCVKMETSTQLTITPASDSNITLVFDGVSKGFKLDGTKFTTSAEGKYTFAANGGQAYILTKGDSMNLFLIIFEKSNGTGITEIEAGNEASRSAMYDIQGRCIVAPAKGQLYIINGKKFIGK